MSGWKDALIDAIIADDGSGGLSAGTDGLLEVDFDAMYTHNRSKFEALLKSLKMQIPLEAPLDVFVNKSSANASDNTDDITSGSTTYKRGSETYPFRTIQAAVNHVTQTYALGANNISIKVVANPADDYNEDLTLPAYNATTGLINLRAANYGYMPIINHVSVTGGLWRLFRIKITDIATDPNSAYSTYDYVITCSGSGVLSLYGCEVYGEYEGDAPTSRYIITLIFASSGGTVYFIPIEGYQAKLTCIKGNANAAYFIQCNNGTIGMPRSRTTYTSTTYEILCSGTCTTFADISARSSFAVTGASPYDMTFVGTVTGKKYDVRSLSTVFAPTGGFPGTDSTGDVDATTFAIYDEDTGHTE